MAETEEEKAKREAKEKRDEEIQVLVGKGVRRALAEMTEEKKKAGGKKTEPPERDKGEKGFLDHVNEFFGIED